MISCPYIDNNFSIYKIQWIYILGKINFTIIGRSKQGCLERQLLHDTNRPPGMQHIHAWRKLKSWNSRSSKLNVLYAPYPRSTVLSEQLDKWSTSTTRCMKKKIRLWEWKMPSTKWEDHCKIVEARWIVVLCIICCFPLSLDKKRSTWLMMSLYTNQPFFTFGNCENLLKKFFASVIVGFGFED